MKENANRIGIHNTKKPLFLPKIPSLDDDLEGGFNETNVVDKVNTSGKFVIFYDTINMLPYLIEVEPVDETRTLGDFIRNIVNEDDYRKKVKIGTKRVNSGELLKFETPKEITLLDTFVSQFFTSKHEDFNYRIRLSNNKIIYGRATDIVDETSRELKVKREDMELVDDVDLGSIIKEYATKERIRIDDKDIFAKYLLYLPLTQFRAGASI